MCRKWWAVPTKNSNRIVRAPMVSSKSPTRHSRTSNAKYAVSVAIETRC
jgi:hypothetical protein